MFLSPFIYILKSSGFRNINNNLFDGMIPPELGNLSNLRSLSELSNHYISFDYLVEICVHIYTDIRCDIFRLISCSMMNSNNLTGELPSQLNNLKELTELYVSIIMFYFPHLLTLFSIINMPYPESCSGLSSNNFIGKLPSFESWRKLEKL